MKRIWAVLAMVTMLLMTGCGWYRAAPESTASVEVSAAPESSVAPATNAYAAHSDGVPKEHTPQAIKARKKLVVAIAQDNKPYCFTDKEGQMQGMDVLLARRLGEALGVDTVLLPVHAIELADVVRAGEADFALGGRLPVDENLVHTTTPYSGGPCGVVVLVEHRNRYKRPQDLDTRILACVETYPEGEALAKALLKTAQITAVDSPEAGVNKLRAGRCAALLTDVITASALVADNADLAMCAVQLESPQISAPGAQALVMSGNEVLLKWADETLGQWSKNGVLGSMMNTVLAREDLK